MRLRFGAALAPLLLAVQAPPRPAAVAALMAEPARVQAAHALVERHRCRYCHGKDLEGHDNVPRLPGQREEVLLQALCDFKSNARPGYDAAMAEVMQPIDDAAMQDLAFLLARTR